MNAFSPAPLAAPLPGPPRLQRSVGEAAVVLALRDGKPCLRDLRQRGSAKAILPRSGGLPEVVFLNTSGGLTGGDRLSYRLDLGQGVRATATTQTAERAYRAAPLASPVAEDAAPSPTAEVTVTLNLGENGWLDWLPQETILFDASALSRRTTITLAPGAGCLALEAVVLGRPAMGETVTRLAFQDRREIRQGGQLIHLEPLRLASDALDSPATLDGARAFASLVMVTPAGEALLTPLRRLLDEPGCRAGASFFNGKLVCRILAQDGWPMRRQITRILALLRGRELPRVWQSLERMA